MVKDAEAHAAEDKKRRAAIEARNQAEALIHSAEKQLKDNEGKVAPADKQAVEAAIEALKGVKDSDDTAAIEAKTNDLTGLSKTLTGLQTSPGINEIQDAQNELKANGYKVEET